MKNSKDNFNNDWAKRTVRGGVLGSIIGVIIVSILFMLKVESLQNPTESTLTLALMISIISGTVVGMIMGAFQDKI